MPCGGGQLCGNPSCPCFHPNEDGRSHPPVESKRSNQLPVVQIKEEFCLRLYEERVIVLTSPTGSGKTTQIPQFCAEYFEGIVVCTQPRQLAVQSIAHRIAEEYDGCTPGESVGFSTGSQYVPGKRILLMTNEALLAEARKDLTREEKDRFLRQVSVLMIDEAHERTLTTEVVLGLAKLLLIDRTDFHVVVASASINPDPFLEFFGCQGGPLTIHSSVYEVNIKYMPTNWKGLVNGFQEGILEDMRQLNQLIVNTLADYSDGNVLVFLPSQLEIEQALTVFMSIAPHNCVGMPLFAAMPYQEQYQILNFHSQRDSSSRQRMVVFCCSIAETSLTVPGVSIVIDTGLARTKYFDQQRRMEVDRVTFVSRSSATQRSGRAGRISNGICLRLYHEHELLETDLAPEILRLSLDTVVLRLVQLGLHPENFPFMNRPNASQLAVSFETLTRLQCLNSEDYSITSLGLLFASQAFSPNLCAFVFVAAFTYNELVSTFHKVLDIFLHLLLGASGNNC